jgi:hypothetical protein
MVMQMATRIRSQKIRTDAKVKIFLSLPFFSFFSSFFFPLSLSLSLSFSLYPWPVTLPPPFSPFSWRQTQRALLSFFFRAEAKPPFLRCSPLMNLP